MTDARSACDVAWHRRCGQLLRISDGVKVGDLAVNHAKLASTHLKLGNAPEALIELRKGREIMARLVAISPTNEQWKKDLEGFDGQIALLEGQTREAERN